MYNIISHQINAYHNHNEMLFQKDTITSVGEDVEKLEPSYIAGRKEKWYSYYGKAWQFL